MKHIREHGDAGLTRNKNAFLHCVIPVIVFDDKPPLHGRRQAVIPFDKPVEASSAVLIHTADMDLYLCRIIKPKQIQY